MGDGPSIQGDATATHESFCDRMCKSLVGMCIGVVLFFVAIAITGWNEGDYVTQQEVVAKAESAAQPFGCTDPLPTDKKALIFLQGCALTNLPAWTGGSDFEMNVTGAWMKTSVEMYQWNEVKHTKEQKDGSGGKTTLTWYTHERVWSSDLKSSPAHCDQPSATARCRVPRCTTGYTYPGSAMSTPSGGACNPASLPADPNGGTRYATEGSISLGANAKLNKELTAQLTSSTAVKPSNVRTAAPAAELPLPVSSLTTNNTWWSAADARRAWRCGTRWGCAGTQPAAGPRVGDVRLSWAVASATTATALAAVGAGGLLVPWQSGAVCRICGLNSQRAAPRLICDSHAVGPRTGTEGEGLRIEHDDEQAAGGQRRRRRVLPDAQRRARHQGEWPALAPSLCTPPLVRPPPAARWLSSPPASLHRYRRRRSHLPRLLLLCRRKVWTIRVVSLLLFFISPYLVLQPIALAPEIVPCIGQMIADLVGCAVCCASLLIGFSTFLLVTALCWIWFRPSVAAG